MGAPAAVRARLTRAQWDVLILLVISVSINYIDRGNLSVAAPAIREELRFDPKQLGVLLASFFATYGLLQPVAGWMVDRYSVRWLYGGGFLLWSVATSVTGLTHGFGALLALRLLLGVGESVAYPAYSNIIARTLPETHRGLANALVDAGSKCGPAIGTLIGGLVIDRYGWRFLFIALGLGSLAWLPPWFIWGPRTEKIDPAHRENSPGLLEILGKRDAWGTFLGLFCCNYAWYFLLTWLPSYLVMERHFSTRLMAVTGSLPFWGIAASSVTGGWLSDRWIARGGTPTRVRKTFAVGGLLGSTVILPAAVVSNPVACLGLLMVASLAFGCLTSNLWAITQTLAGPDAAGKWTGWQNMMGNVAGFAAPYFTGVIVNRTGSFLMAFVAVAVAMLIGAMAFLVIVQQVAPVRWKRLPPS
jgi:MFS transporter, ACS family, D-galactonate transporter